MVATSKCRRRSRGRGGSDLGKILAPPIIVESARGPNPNVAKGSSIGA
jgi:hypothetical protein